jgi:hypothetical protein
MKILDLPEEFPLDISLSENIKGFMFSIALSNLLLCFTG